MDAKILFSLCVYQHEVLHSNDLILNSFQGSFISAHIFVYLQPTIVSFNYSPSTACIWHNDNLNSLLPVMNYTFRTIT